MGLRYSFSDKLLVIRSSNYSLTKYLVTMSLRYSFSDKLLGNPEFKLLSLIKYLVTMGLRDNCSDKVIGRPKRYIILYYSILLYCIL
jgi:hypothetical protein